MDNSYQNSTISQILEAIINESSFDGSSSSEIGDILLSILNNTYYDKEPESVIGKLLIKLKAKIAGESFEPYDGTHISRIADILLATLNAEEYNEAPQSKIAELLLELKDKIEGIVKKTVISDPWDPAYFDTNLSRPIVSGKFTIPLSLYDDIDYLEICISDNPSFDEPRRLINIDIKEPTYGGEITIDKNGNCIYTQTFDKYLFTGSETWTLSEDELYFYCDLELSEEDKFKDRGSCMVSNGTILRLSDNGITVKLFLSENRNISKDTDLNTVFIRDTELVYKLEKSRSKALDPIDPIITFDYDNYIVGDNANVIEITYLYKEVE